MLKYPYLIAWSLLFAILISTTTSFIPVNFVGSSFIIHHHDITTNNLLMADSATEISDASTIHHKRNIIVLCHNVSQDTADGIFDVNNLLKGRIDVLARCITSSLWISNNIRSDTTVYLMLCPHNITIEVRGSCMRSLTPDERTTALYLQRTLWSDNSYSTLNNTTFKTPQKRYTTYPQSTQMTDEKKIRMEVKGRNKLIDRIRTAHKRKKPLQGFILHRNDTLQARLEQIVNEDDEHTVYMLSETGDLLWDVLEESNSKLTPKTNNGHRRSRRTTTLILGNQIGYSADDESLLLQSPIVQEVSLGPLSLLTSQCITITHHYLDRYESL